jgi:hypothetical protein
MHCLILEGPLYNESMEYIIKMIKNIPTIITTWNDESQEKIILLKKYALDIIFNTPPKFSGGPGRVNYPNTTLLSGLHRAKELGFSHALRFRADNYCPTINEFITIFANESQTKLVGLCWFSHILDKSPYGYIMEHIMYGPIHLLIEYRSNFQIEGDARFVEAFLQESYLKKTPVSYEDTVSDFCFILNKLVEHKQEVYYTHHNTKQGDIIKLYNSLNVRFR